MIRNKFMEEKMINQYDESKDFMYENGEYMMELAGMSDTGLDYIVYCEEE